MEKLVGDGAQVRQYLSLLFGSACEDYGLSFCVFMIPSMVHRYFRSVEEAVPFCLEQTSAGQHVYAGMGLVFSEPKGKGRGSASQVEAIAGVWSDVDIAHEHAHGQKRYPSRAEDARGLCRIGPCEPSLVVDSGYGLHAYWLFREPWVFADEDERLKGVGYLCRVGHTLTSFAKSKGFEIDPVSDMARVLRIPGTINWKVAKDPRAVRIAEAIDQRYNADDLDPYLSSIEYAEKSSIRLLPPMGHFNLNSGFSPDWGVIQAIEANQPSFMETWLKKRADLGDDNSRYDMALANFFVGLEWSDQQIVDYLVAWRREIARDPKLRVDYYQRTIGKVRATRDTEKAYAGIKSESGDTPIVASSNDRAAILNSLRGLLKIQVEGFEQLDEDQSQYFLLLGGDESISLGTAKDLRFEEFRARIMDRCLVVIPGEVRKVWDKVVTRFMAICERRVTDEPRLVHQYETLLATYVSGCGRVYTEEEWSSALRTKAPFLRDGLLWVHRDSFLDYCRVALNVRIPRGEFNAGLHLLGARVQRHSGDGRRGVYRGISLALAFPDSDLGKPDPASGAVAESDT